MSIVLPDIYDTLSVLLVAMLTGIVVGVTGMGGGALMTPALILLGVPPASAIANDLVAAAVTKGVAASVHWRTGRPHFTIALLLVIASVPTAALGGWLAWHAPALRGNQGLLRLGIGLALLVAAAAYVARAYMRRQPPGSGHSEVSPRVLATLLVGALGGLLVGLTSVGAGSIMMVALILLYPAMDGRRLVGTDLVQSVPLVSAAAIAHLLNGGVSAALLIPLLIGGPCGSYIGSRLSGRVSTSATRVALVAVLTLTGSMMLHLSLPYALAAAVLAATPLLWQARAAKGVTSDT